MPGETALNGRCEFKGLGAAGIHVAGKVEDASNTRGGSSGEDQTGARTIAPTHDSCTFQVQRVHYSENVGRHRLIGEWSEIAGAAAMPSAINEHGTMAGTDQLRDLVSPIAAMAEATMQQDHRRAGPVCRVPDTRTAVFDVALSARDRQGRGAMRLEILKIVVV